MMKMIRGLYNWTMGISRHKHAVWGLGGISFIESSFFPLPPDIILIPMCIANRQKAFWYATVCSIASVLGGIFGYAIGYFLYDILGAPIIEFYGLQAPFENFSAQYNAYGTWIVLGAGLTPIPYKIITIASGVTHMNLPLFIIMSFIGRAMRFYLVAALLWKYGQPIQDFIEKYLGLLSIAFFVLLVGGFALIKFMA